MYDLLGHRGSAQPCPCAPHWCAQRHPGPGIAMGTTFPLDTMPGPGPSPDKSSQVRDGKPGVPWRLFLLGSRPSGSGAPLKQPGQQAPLRTREFLQISPPTNEGFKTRVPYVWAAPSWKAGVIHSSSWELGCCSAQTWGTPRHPRRSSYPSTCGIYKSGSCPFP